jgi:large subunit ribosomal protein L24
MAITKRHKIKLHVKKGDLVYVRSGEDKGKKGRIVEILASENKALVEGINVVSRHTQPDAQNTKGGIIKKEAPVHISKLMLLDSKGQPTRVGRMEVNGETVRYAKKSGDKKEVIK